MVKISPTSSPDSSEEAAPEGAPLSTWIGSASIGHTWLTGSCPDAGGPDTTMAGSAAGGPSRSNRGRCSRISARDVGEELSSTAVGDDSGLSPTPGILISSWAISSSSWSRVMSSSRSKAKLSQARFSSGTSRGGRTAGGVKVETGVVSGGDRGKPRRWAVRGEPDSR